MELVPLSGVPAEGGKKKGSDRRLVARGASRGGRRLFFKAYFLMRRYEAGLLSADHVTDLYTGKRRRKEKES